MEPRDTIASHDTPVDDPRPRDDVLISTTSGVIAAACGHDGPQATPVLIGRGARVFANDGLVGHVDHVLVDPDNDAIRALVIHPLDPLNSDAVIPARWVVQADAENIVVAAELASFRRPLPSGRIMRAASQARCPQCGAAGTVEPYGDLPVYPAPGRQPSDLRVTVLVCRQCGHLQVRQTV